MIGESWSDGREQGDVSRVGGEGGALDSPSNPGPFYLSLIYCIPL